MAADFTVRPLATFRGLRHVPLVALSHNSLFPSLTIEAGGVTLRIIRRNHLSFEDIEAVDLGRRLAHQITFLPRNGPWTFSANFLDRAAVRRVLFCRMVPSVRDKGGLVMTGWEMFVFLVASTVVLVVGIAWFRWWKRDPERFKAGWQGTSRRDSPMRGGIDAVCTSPPAGSPPGAQEQQCEQAQPQGGVQPEPVVLVRTGPSVHHPDRDRLADTVILDGRGRLAFKAAAIEGPFNPLSSLAPDARSIGWSISSISIWPLDGIGDSARSKRAPSTGGLLSGGCLRMWSAGECPQVGLLIRGGNVIAHGSCLRETE